MSKSKGLKTVGKETYSIMVQIFEYDRNIPLDARVLYCEENEAHIREKIVFRGMHNSRVPGYFGVPTIGSPPYPCILLAHSWGSSKEDWWSEDTGEGVLTRELLSSGFAVLTLDQAYHGERTFINDYDEPLSIVTKYNGINKYRELLVQSVVEHRLAIDYLTTRAEINKALIGILGYSLGAVMTFILAGVDPRITVAVTCAGSPISDFYMNRIGMDESATIRMAPVAPQNFAPAIKQTSFLMLNGKSDPWGDMDEILSMYELISSPRKDLVLYEGGHGPLADYNPKAVDWFRRYLR